MYNILLILLLTSCNYIQNPLGLKGEAIEYAEGLFKNQNLVTYRVMMLLEDELSIAGENMLSLAELKMHDKCSLLNEMANHEIEGEKVSLYFKSQVKNSFKSCEQSVKEVEFILRQLE